MVFNVALPGERIHGMTTPNQTGGSTVVQQSPEATHLEAPVWITIVWDDPVNLMSYVTHVFASYFGYPRAKAERLMLQVHQEGRSVVSEGGREEMERDATAMHGYGLWATVEQQS